VERERRPARRVEEDDLSLAAGVRRAPRQLDRVALEDDVLEDVAAARLRVARAHVVIAADEAPYAVHTLCSV
jgi:hypothetical protein